jgi:hypothetical protein
MWNGAASASSSAAGAGMTDAAGISAYSANPPNGSAAGPMTRSPGAKPGASGPGCTTSPHSSAPGVNGSGGRTW